MHDWQRAILPSSSNHETTKLVNFNGIVLFLQWFSCRLLWWFVQNVWPCECVSVLVARCLNIVHFWPFRLGACGTLIGHPLDTVKTWQQASNTRISTTIYDIIVRNNGVSGSAHFPLVFLCKRCQFDWHFNYDAYVMLCWLTPSSFHPSLIAQRILPWNDVSTVYQRRLELNTIRCLW